MKKTLILILTLSVGNIFSQQIFSELSYSNAELKSPQYNVEEMIEMQNGVKKIANDYNNVIDYLERNLTNENCRSLLGNKCSLYRKEIGLIKSNFRKLEFSNDYFENRSYVLNSVKKMNRIDYELFQSIKLKYMVSQHLDKIDVIKNTMTDQKCVNDKKKCKQISKELSRIDKKYEYVKSKASYVHFQNLILDYDIKISDFEYDLKQF